jgi:hypothetical protein
MTTALFHARSLALLAFIALFGFACGADTEQSLDTDTEGSVLDTPTDDDDTFDLTTPGEAEGAIELNACACPDLSQIEDCRGSGSVCQRFIESGTRGAYCKRTKKHFRCPAYVTQECRGNGWAKGALPCCSGRAAWFTDRNNGTHAPTRVYKCVP